MLTKFRSLTTRQKLALIPAAVIGFVLIRGLSYLVTWLAADEIDPTVQTGASLGIAFGVLLFPTICKAMDVTFARVGGKPKTPAVTE